MSTPLDLNELMTWIVTTTVILLLSWEFLNPRHRFMNIVIDRKKLGHAVILFSMIFLIFAMIKIYEIYITTQ